MTTIDIRKPISSMAGLPKVRRAGKLPEEKPAQEEKPLVMKTRKSFIARFIEIAIFDVKRKFGLVKEPAEKLQRRVADFEKFEEFCKLARGEK